MDGRPLEAFLRVERPRPGWLEFRRPVETIVADGTGVVLSRLERVAQAVDDGLWAAGYVAYEAAPAFDPAFRAHPPVGPVLAFGLFEEAVRRDRLPPSRLPGFELGAWEVSETPAVHERAVQTIRRRIGRGDVYQVNHTFRLTAPCSGDPWGLLLGLWRAQHGAHSAWIRHGNRVLCSASPELFFKLEGHRLTSRPMKGTAPRAADAAEDRRLAEVLAASNKDRAENLMIVDMMRNDLGRVARSGTVRVPHLFEIETLPTVHQMTSTVDATTDAPWHEVLANLFPAASITGAPKAAATGVIHDLEPEPRGVYTGTIGHIRPDGGARFSVAIRTAEIDLVAGRAVYGSGGGIVWDSRPEAEYRECLTKALVLRDAADDFELFETLRWTPDGGFRHLDRHLDRLAASATHFGRPCDLALVRRTLDEAVAGATKGRRVRLALDRSGFAAVELGRLPIPPASPWKLGLATDPVRSDNPWLGHKTNRRAIYERARSERPEADDVILWNEKGRLTETTLANLAVELDGVWVTPPVTAGLLPGVARADLLDRGRLAEGEVHLEALDGRSRWAVFNSLRGWIDAELLPSATKKGAGLAAGLRKKEE